MELVCFPAPRLATSPLHKASLVYASIAEPELMVFVDGIRCRNSSIRFLPAAECLIAWYWIFKGTVTRLSEERAPPMVAVVIFSNRLAE